MGLNDKELSRIRMLTNNIIVRNNTETPYAASAEIKRDGEGARITLVLRPGKNKPSDPMVILGDLADAIRTDLRLETNHLGDSRYGTGESQFETTPTPSFNFQVWLKDPFQDN